MADIFDLILSDSIKFIILITDFFIYTNSYIVSWKAYISCFLTFFYNQMVIIICAIFTIVVQDMFL